MWIYGCLSEDTEILTDNGWKNKNTIQLNDNIYSMDLEKDTIIKNKVKHIFDYDYDGEMVNLKNQNTDQLLTPNHHCIVNDGFKTTLKGKTKYNVHDYWYYKDAYQIRSQKTKLPLASKYNGSLEIGNLFSELLGWVISEGCYHKDTNAISIYQSSANSEYVTRIRYVLGKLKIEYSEYKIKRSYKGKDYILHQFYIGNGKSKEIVNKIKKICPDKKLNWRLLELSLTNKDYLIKGLLMGDGSKDKNTKIGFSNFTQYDMNELDIFQALLHLSGKQGWINTKKMCCSIHDNNTTEIQEKHNKNRFVKYKGKVWCIETEIGNFIARRKGKIFITGNSGFPKSMDLSKAIESKLLNGSANTKDFRKLDGTKVESGNMGFSKMQYEHGSRPKDYTSDKHLRVDKVNYKTQLGKKYIGWGTSLKPAYEPIIVARKPFKRTLVDNVIENGLGGINIDECRIENTNLDEYDLTQRKESGKSKVYKDGRFLDGLHKVESKHGVTNEGRFPSNVILTYNDDDFEEVCGGFPYTSNNGGKIENPSFRDVAKKSGVSSLNFGLTKNVERIDTGYVAPSDSGSACRYFYNAKATSKDRDEGLENYEIKNTGELQGGRKEGSAGSIMLNEDGTTIVNPYAGSGSPKRNIHPTVKPTLLMQYLVRLVTPKNGTVLDCFMGSGSTGKAVMYENKERNKNYKFIGIELTDEYLPIAKARIDYVLKQPQQMNLFDFFDD